MATGLASIRISPATPGITLRLDVPGSKSLSNRVLPVAAFADGESVLHNVLDADDTRVMADCLERLGFSPRRSGSTVTLRGLGGTVPVKEASLDVGLSGTTIRFLLPLLASAHGTYRLHGTERMHERPVQDQLDALNSLGADAVSDRGTGCPPVTLRASGLAAGEVTVRGDQSSQYLSGMLLAAPLARGPVTIRVSGELQSKPFVDLTTDVMEAFGVQTERQGYDWFRVTPQKYRAAEYSVEGDATAAGYWWVAAAITGSTVTVGNIGTSTRQGDKRLADVLGIMGCTVTWTETSCTVTGPERLQGGSFDLNDMPDQALALAVCGLFTDGPLELTNIPNLRIKETDRLHALATELGRLGATVDERPDGITVSGPGHGRPADIETYGDHRMAMAFAVAGLMRPGITILDPACVNKTYPEFFSDLTRMQVAA